MVVLEQDQPPSKKSVFGSSWVVVLAKDQPKTSILACFWQWLGGGTGTGQTAIENEHTCSFLAVAKDQHCRRSVVPVML